MFSTHLIAYFFGGAFFANAIPHFVCATMGKPFQSPFANPPGKGLSSSVVNALWGSFNGVVSYFLIFRVGAFDPRSDLHALAAGLGLILGGIWLAQNFGKINGGNLKS